MGGTYRAGDRRRCPSGASGGASSGNGTRLRASGSPSVRTQTEHSSTESPRPCPRRILSLWFPRLAAERVLRAEPRLAGRAAGGGRRTPRRAGAGEPDGGGRGGWASGAAWRSATRARSVPELVTRPEDPAPARRLPARRCGAGPGASRPGSPRRARRWCSTSPAARISSAARPGSPRGSRRGGGLRPHASGSASPTRSARPGRWRATPARAPLPAHAGDAIDQEARATRSRAQKRRWERGGAPPPARRPAGAAVRRIVPPGETLAHIGALPVAALRLEPGEIERAAGARPAPDRRRWRRCRAPQLARRVGPGVGRPARPGARPRARAGLAGAARRRSSRCA